MNRHFGIAIPGVPVAPAPPPINPMDEDIWLDAESANEVLMELADEVADDLMQQLDDAFPAAMIPTSITLPPRERLARYLANTNPADLHLIADTEYVEKYRLGIYPPPESPFWAGLLLIPEEFKDTQRDFRVLWQRYIASAVPPAETSSAPAAASSPAAPQPVQIHRDAYGKATHVTGSDGALKPIRRGADGKMVGVG